MDKWSGKTAIVTGGSSGIGAAVAYELVCNGMTVINLDKNIDETTVVELNNKMSTKGGKLYANKCDISDMKSLKETFKWIEETFSSVNVLINCAGLGHHLPVLSDRDDATDKINDTIDVNFKACVHVTREAVRLIKKTEDYGMIINVASVFGHYIPFPIVGNVYAATKFAVRAFSEIIRQELIISGCDKIKISNVSPGTVKTNVRVTGGWENTEEFYKNRPYLEPKEIGSAVLYLLSTPNNVNVTELTIRSVGEKF
ncbi:farnesol dehydrogenase-like [Chironomus tepperi]|uniref:farnesol dehydrogenase-like n=1 Tax=Chironomus tepperi TaxID=113505 RepID=UPI00391FB92C